MTRADLSLLRRWIARPRAADAAQPARPSFFTFAFPLMLLRAVRRRSTATRRSPRRAPPAARCRSRSSTRRRSASSASRSACYTTRDLRRRDRARPGLLKRVRGTPLPMPIYLGAWLTGAALTGFASVVLLFAVAVPAFGVDIYPRMLPAAIVTLRARRGVPGGARPRGGEPRAKTADQAVPVAQLTFLPLSFISGIWFPLDGAPDWLVTIANFFPLYHIVDAFDALLRARRRPAAAGRRATSVDRAVGRRRPVRRGAAVPGRAERAGRRPAPPRPAPRGRLSPAASPYASARPSIGRALARANATASARG